MKEDTASVVSEKAEDEDINLTATEKSMQGRGKVGIRNITGIAKAGRGTTQCFEIGSGIIRVLPGKSIPISDKIWQRIKDNRDSHGNLVWKQVPLSECDKLEVFKIGGKPTKDGDKLDDSFMANIDSLVVIDLFDEAAELIATCDSKLTLNSVMQRYNSQETIQKEARQIIGKACVSRIAFLSKKE